MTTVTVRVCSVDGCGRPHLARGWCNMHYQRWMRKGDPLTVRPIPADRRCSIDGCERRVDSHGLCQSHRYYQRYHGDPLVGDRRKARPDWNPWTGRVPCPRCGSDVWTMPYCPGESLSWRCVKGKWGGCGISFVPLAAVT